MIPVFIGYDPKETIAYHTCCNSLIRNATQPLSIVPLALNLFSNYTETHNDGSNQFIYTRFLVPQLLNYNGWAIFIDGDMVVRDDISKLYNLKNNDYAVMVVKHEYKTKQKVKYLGQPNYDYPRKNWSSVVLWNCSHIKNKILNDKFVETNTGKILHRFSWLNDDEIGSLPIEWNWLPDEYGENPDAKLLHYTLGSPCFTQYKNTNQSQVWHDEYFLTTCCKQMP